MSAGADTFAAASPVAMNRLLVRKRDFNDCRIETTVAPTAQELTDGQVLLRIDRFGFSANNITYVALGSAMHYWEFFPAGDEWGCVPVWGYANVVASHCENVAVGDRYFGYWPMASHCVVEPAHATPHGFIDGAPHRKALPAVYNQYQRTASDPKYDANNEDAYMLLRPLFITSFMLHDFLNEQRYFDATTLVLSSASSKTAYALAFFASRQSTPRVRVVGLTSPSNVAFVQSLGCYDAVLTYDDVEQLDALASTVYADFSGNALLRARVHRHLAERLMYSAAVGLTDWDALAPSEGLPGPKPTLFFAPTQIKKRAVEWGPGGIEQRVADGWSAFLEPLRGWMMVTHRDGADAALQLYRDMLHGLTSPRDGFTVSL